MNGVQKLFILKTLTTYLERLWTPMDAGVDERYMLAQHVPDIYLNTYLVQAAFSGMAL